MKLMLLLLLVFGSCAKNKGVGDGYGFGGRLVLSVQLKDQKISDIKVLENEDTEYIAEAAFPILKERIINANSPIVDSVSGATYTSFAYKTAVADALRQLGQDIPAITVETSAPMTLELIQGEPINTDILVIGGGPAGLMAAVKAQESGANVTLIEKLDILGGNGIHTEVLYGIPNTQAQKEKGIEDSEELFYETLKAGNPLETDERLKSHAHVASKVDQWLRDYGIEMNYAVNSGDPMFRMIMQENSEKGYAGKHIVMALGKKARELGVNILTGTRAYDLLISNNQIIGASVSSGSTNFQINAKSVIVATGGFAANIDLVHAYNSQFTNINFTSNSKGATGDLIPAFEKLGISLRNMDVMNVHPVVEIATRMPGGGFNPITEFMLVNQDGKRFINEVNTRDALSLAIAEQPDSMVYFVFDHASRELWAVPSLEGVFKDKVIIADTPEELATKLRVDDEAFVATLDTFNKAANGEITDPFGRTSFQRPKVKGPYYALRITSAFHMTRGGIATDKDTRVKTTAGTTINGLYGAGEVTDITSGALTAAVGFGYLAGEKAAEYVKNN